ncbi:hypothetical protein TNIN_337261 [Trichonephila inaurata madagascariensis]|uniref:Uncharacterized protein n=1 Tax=Trichonephila inaurata madagascariensis TaxID=2747483 RepID=A0A8X6XJJ5_9ARAC|nr:hypothetical protein TNIN_337261 [Trichonephila inaurata madagascariensis]
MTTRNRLNDELRGRVIDSLETEQSRADVTRWLEVSRVGPTSNQRGGPGAQNRGIKGDHVTTHCGQELSPTQNGVAGDYRGEKPGAFLGTQAGKTGFPLQKALNGKRNSIQFGTVGRNFVMRPLRVKKCEGHWVLGGFFPPYMGFF